MKGMIDISVAAGVSGPESRSLVFNPDYFVSATYGHEINLNKHGFTTCVKLAHTNGLFWTRLCPGEIQQLINDYYTSEAPE